MISVPTTEWTPTTSSELSRIVSDNFQGEKLPFSPVGGRTSLSSGGQVPPETVILATSELHQIVDYPALDMTITVEAGIRVEELQEELAKQQQRLPIDIPQVNRATLGGAIASNACGPSRFGYGTFRDYVIGISAVDARGRLFSAGGKVVKNVAGYDLCKLLTGSMGTLATITEVTLKLRPLFEKRLLVVAAFDPDNFTESVLDDLSRSKTTPVMMDALNPKASRQLSGEGSRHFPDQKTLLWIGFEGSESETGWQATTIIEELNRHQPDEIITLQNDEHKQVYEALVEFQTASDDPVTFRASLPKSQCAEFLRLATSHEVAGQAHVGNGVVYGHLPDRCTSATLANEIISPLRTFTEQAGGALSILHCDSDWKSEIDLYGKPSDAWKLMTGIKKVLDPAGILSPNRMI